MPNKPICQPSHYFSMQSMRNGLSVILLLPSSVGNEENQAEYAIRLVDEVCDLEVGILRPASLQAIATLNKSPEISSLQMKV